MNNERLTEKWNNSRKEEKRTNKNRQDMKQWTAKYDRKIKWKKERKEMREEVVAYPKLPATGCLQAKISQKFKYWFSSQVSKISQLKRQM